MDKDSFPEELEKALEAHSGRTGEITDSFSKELLATDVPPLIYHYTDDRGLKGILETGRLWFTDLFKLNDPSELNHGIRLALDILESEANRGPPEAKQFSKMFSTLVNNLEVIGHFFVCCFSENGDDLGQWRAYADNGHGYAIGFDAGALEQTFVKGVESEADICSTFPVTYDDKRLREIFEKLVVETIPAISMPEGKKLDNDAVSTYLQKLTTNLASSYVMASLFFKHEAYSNEQEYRFLQVFRADREVPNVKTRIRPYSLIRYREFDWKSVANESVKEIVFGPAGDRKIAPMFAYDCLREYLPAPRITSIKGSEVPYRSETE